MSLDWSLTKIDDYDNLCWNQGRGDEYDEDPDKQYLDTTTNRLIWRCLAVGMPGITEKNHEEFTARIMLIEDLDGVEDRTTYEEIRSHIGLSTNVAKIPFGVWLTRIGNNYKDRAKSKRRRYEKEERDETSKD